MCIHNGIFNKKLFSLTSFSILQHSMLHIIVLAYIRLFVDLAIFFKVTNFFQ